MPGAFRTRHERRLWLCAGGLLLAIYSSLYVVRPIVDGLRERGLLRLLLALLFFAVAAAVLRWRMASGLGRRQLAVLALAGGLYLLVLWPIRLPEERFHLIEYGLLGGLVYAALLERRRPGAGLGWAPREAALAVLLSGLAGWLDEGIQYLLPNRHYDWVDVGLNLLAALLAVGTLAALSEAAHADRAAAR